VFNDLRVVWRPFEPGINDFVRFRRVLTMETPRLYTHLDRNHVPMAYLSALKVTNGVPESFQPMLVHHKAPLPVFR
jgi:hypothetical protein